ncbi:unnamed protein product [Protopolystoma xenopodis]|uniref:Uncharacterized protein n=1 Tax=Protopolystoma xenopodis TaxID=117903 RepID=A0A3S5CMZ0_9PLAT|nr:unnamed protein product [Protopolystoma xenopodis]
MEKRVTPPKSTPRHRALLQAGLGIVRFIRLCGSFRALPTPPKPTTRVCVCVCRMGSDDYRPSQLDGPAAWTTVALTFDIHMLSVSGAADATNQR